MLLNVVLAALRLITSAVAQMDAPRPDIVLDPLPPLIQCERAAISWSGGRLPYAVGIYPENWQDGGERLQYLGATGEMEEQWLVRVPAGTAVVVRVWDSLKEVYSEPAVIQEGSDDSCLSSSRLPGASGESGVTGTIPTPFAPTPTSTSFNTASNGGTISSDEAGPNRTDGAATPEESDLPSGAGTYGTKVWSLGMSIGFTLAFGALLSW